MVETREDTIKNRSSYYSVNAEKFRRHYKNHSSGYKDWEQKAHAEDYMLFPENVDEFMSIDEVSLSQGELYTFVTNKNGKGVLRIDVPHLEDVAHLTKVWFNQQAAQAAE